MGMVQAKQLTGSMEVRQGSAGAWMYAGQVKGLFQAASPSAAQPAQPMPPAAPLEVILDDEAPPDGPGAVNLGLSFIIADSFLTGIVATLAGVASFIGSLIVAWYFMLGILLLIVAGCCFLLSYGLMTQQKWARTLLLATYGLHVAVGILMMIILFNQVKKLEKLELKEIGSTGMTLGIIGRGRRGYRTGHHRSAARLAGPALAHFGPPQRSSRPTDGPWNRAVPVSFMLLGDRSRPMFTSSCSGARASPLR
jgi:hypothetical protein